MELIPTIALSIIFYVKIKLLYMLCIVSYIDFFTIEQLPSGKINL